MKIYQYQTSIYRFDAMSNNVLGIDGILRSHGCDTQIIADDFDSNLNYKIGLASNINFTEDDLLIAHFGIGKPFFDNIGKYPCKKIMIYHNITPPHFASNIVARIEAKKGLSQLAKMGPFFDACIAVSEFNARDLKKYDYKNVSIIPFLRDFSYLEQNQFNPLLAKKLAKQDAIIFIGRVSPQKRQTDIVKAFYFYKKYYNKKAKLYIIGGYGTNEMACIELQNTIANLKLSSSVEMTGKVTDADLITYLKFSKLFLSMSEHEGFCVPIVESMHFNLPVLGYSKGGAVVDTAGSGGLFFNEKEFFSVAGLIDQMIKNTDLRNKIIQNQKEEIKRFDPETIKGQIWDVVKQYIKS